MVAVITVFPQCACAVPFSRPGHRLSQTTNVLTLRVVSLFTLEVEFKNVHFLLLVVFVDTNMLSNTTFFVVES